MTRLAQDYLLTGNELSGREAKRRLLSIVAWDPKGSTSLHHNDEVGTDNALWLDFDRDGYLDLYTGVLEPTQTGNLLYRNNRDGTFSDMTQEAGLNVALGTGEFQASRSDEPAW